MRTLSSVNQGKCRNGRLINASRPFRFNALDKQRLMRYPGRVTFANLLASEMERGELTDALFAEQSGITRAQVHNLRTGRSEPTLATFVKMVRILPGLNAIVYTYTKNSAITARPRNGAKEAPKNARSSRSKS